MTRPTQFSRPIIPNVFIGGDPELPDGQAELDCCAESSNTLPDRAFEGATYYGVLSGLGTLVQSKIGTDAGGGSSLAFDSDTAAGNLLVAVLVDRGGTTGPFSLTGWTFIEDAGKSGASEVTMFWRVSPGGPVTVSFNPPTNEVRIYIMEFEGGAAGLATTPTTHSGGASVSSFPVGSLTVTGFSLLVGAVEAGNGVPNTITYTEDAAFTNVGQGQVGGALAPESIVGYRSVTAGSYNYTPTGNNSSLGWGGVLAAFDLGEGWAGGGYLSVDGDDSTYTEIGGTNVLRIDLGDAFEIGRIRLYLATETAGSRTYTLKGATQPDFSDAVTVATLNFTATGSFTPQEVTDSWTPTASYEFWELTGDDETRYLYSFELFEAGASDAAAVAADLADHIDEILTHHTAETDASLVLAPDGAGGVEWRTETGGGGLDWFNVMDYGATNDGTTDDTSAINSAIAALNTATRGVLYFPAGDGYKVTSALTAITAAAVVRGDGAPAYDFSNWGTVINCTSQTAVLFTISAKVGRFEHLALRNTYAGNPTAGTAILVDSSYLEGRCNFEDIHVAGFYDNIDMKVGAQWVMHSVFIDDPVRYGVRIRNTVNPDAGDWNISDSWFNSRAHAATSAIRMESSGGGKISNVKINAGYPLGSVFTTGIDVAIGSGNNTIGLWVSNCSVENISGDAIRVVTTGTGFFDYIIIDGLEVALSGNNTGYAVKISAASNGGHAVAGAISMVVIDSGTFWTDGTARAAVSLTNADRVRLGDYYIDGFNARYTSSGSTNITDDVAVTFGTPTIVLGTAASAGSTDEVIRRDATIVAFDATVPVTQAFGDTAATGSAAFAARRDHKHGMPTGSSNGHYEVIVSGSAPPVAVTNVAEDDWVYGFVPD